MEPVQVELLSRMNDKPVDCESYIGFYGRAGLPAPFASYVIVPISRRWGILRIESLRKDTFGPPYYDLLRQLARKLELAFSITLELASRQGDEVDDR